MTLKEKADLKLSCIYATRGLLGIEGSATYSSKGKKDKPTTEAFLDEAKKLFKWVSEGEESK